MDSGQSPGDVCYGATARALEHFNRRGSILAVAISGGSVESFSSLQCGSKAFPASGSPTVGNALHSPSAMTSSNVHSFAGTSTVSTSSSSPSAQTSNEHSNPDDSVRHNSIDQNSDWRPLYPRLCAYHDCLSLASAWGLGPPTTSIEPRPTGASQAQSPCEDDVGDGRSNDLLASCPAFRNEMGDEPIRRLALTNTSANAFDEAAAATNLDPEMWQREHTAAEVAILEDVSNVYLGGRLCASRQPKIVIEPQDIGSYYYRHCFVGRPHCNFFGMDDSYGPIAVSMIRDCVERQEPSGVQSVANYRLIIRISDSRTMRVSVPEAALSEGTDQKSNRAVLKELLDIACPQVHFGCLRPSTPTPRVEELLLKIDEQPIYTRYKVGVMYCGPGQSTEEQMYNNEHGSPAFDEFLDFLGQRVRLKGFDQYKGGLDIRGDTTGTHSVYAEYQAHEVMFHVTTLLPFTPSNKQQLARKRHIGNDMVTMIFQEPGALPFSPITVRSHFQHVFIIIRVNQACTEDVSYTVAVSRAKDVPSFGPPIPRGATFQKCAEFHDFLMTKIVNAENAVHRSKKFAAMAARTRRESLKELAENFVSAHPNEGPSRIASRFLGGSVRRRERAAPRPMLGECVRGALSWLVDVHDQSLNQRVTCVLGVSAESVVLLEMPSGVVIFATPTHSIIGWANTDMGLKIYYDHGQMLLMRCCTTDSSDRELTTLLRRLESVTKGDEAKEILLRRTKDSESLGFHLQDEGVVTEVHMYQTAWKSGLRQGSRIVEIEGEPVITLSHEQMCEMLSQKLSLRVMMISPALDGSPRRGCEDPHCPAVRGHTEILLTPDTFAKQPLSYQEMLKCQNSRARQLEGWRTAGTSSNSCDEAACLKPIQMNSKPPGYCLHENHRMSYPGVSDPLGPPLPLRSCRAKKHSNSAHNHLCELFQPPLNLQLYRAQSEETLNSPDFSETFDAAKSVGGHQTSELRPYRLRNASRADVMEEAAKVILSNAELGKCQLRLQKALQEKRALEAMVEHLRTELCKERRAHELTRLDLHKLQKYLEMSTNITE